MDSQSRSSLNNGRPGSNARLSQPPMTPPKPMPRPLPTPQNARPLPDRNSGANFQPRPPSINKPPVSLIDQYSFPENNGPNKRPLSINRGSAASVLDQANGVQHIKSNPNTNSPVQRKELPKALVLFEFKGQTERELSIKKGEIIEIMKATEPDGWWFGKTLSGERGHFPAKYVQMMEENEQNSTQSELIAPTPPAKPTVKPPINNAANNSNNVIVNTIINNNDNGAQSSRAKEFFISCKSGDLSTIETYLQHLTPAELNHSFFMDVGDMRASENLDHYTPFEIACLFGHENIVELLLTSPNLELKSKNAKKSPLFFASLSGNVSLCKLLESKKIIPPNRYTTFEEWEFKRPILKSINKGDLEMTKFLCGLFSTLPDDLVSQLKTEGNELTRRQLSMFFRTSGSLPRVTPVLPEYQNNILNHNHSPTNSGRLSGSDRGRGALRSRGSGPAGSRGGSNVVPDPLPRGPPQGALPRPPSESRGPPPKAPPKVPPRTPSMNEKLDNVISHPNTEQDENENTANDPLVISRTVSDKNEIILNSEVDIKVENEVIAHSNIEIQEIIPHNNLEKSQNIQEKKEFEKETVVALLSELSLFSNDLLESYFSNGPITSMLISKFLISNLNQAPDRLKLNDDLDEELRTQLNSYVMNQISEYYHFINDSQSFLKSKLQSQITLKEKSFAASEKRITKIKRKLKRKQEFKARIKELKLQNNGNDWEFESLINRPTSEQLDEYFAILPPKDLANSSVIHQIFLKFRGITYKQEQQIRSLQTIPSLKKSARKLSRRTRELIQIHLLQSHIDSQHYYLFDFENKASLSLFYILLTRKLTNYFISLKISSNSSTPRENLNLQLNTLNDLLNSFISLSTYDSHTNKHILPWGSSLNTIGPLVFTPAPFMSEEYQQFLRHNNKSFASIEQVSFTTFSQKLEQVAEQISKLVCFRYANCISNYPLEKVSNLAKDALTRIVYNFSKGGKNALESLYDPNFLTHFFPQNGHYQKALYGISNEYSDVWSNKTGIVDISYSPPKFYTSQATDLNLGWRIGTEYEANFLQMKSVAVPREGQQFFSSLELLLPEHQESLNKF